MSSICDLLVLSPAEFEAALQPLIDHKHALGVKTQRINLEQIYSDPAYASGRDVQEKIKLAIVAAYRDLGVRYVMLIGDIDKFPVRYTRGYDPNFWGHSFAPSDLYYADLFDHSGNFSSWDADNNGLYGEMNAKQGWTTSWDQLNGDHCDLKPDVAVGRLPVSTVDELATLIRKIIDYENTSSTTWRNRAMLVTGDFDDSHLYAESIGGSLNQRHLAITKHYHEEDWPKMPEVAQRMELLNYEMNSGYGLIFYLGHGAEHEWANWYHQDYIRQLNNAGCLPIILAAGCSTATFAIREVDTGEPYYVTKDGAEYGCKCEDDDLFRKDATFKMSGGSVPSSLQLFSFNYPDSSIRKHPDDSGNSGDLYLDPGAGTDLRLVSAQAGNLLLEFWRSLRSYNYPDRYVRHQNYFGELTPVSSPLDQADGTFRMVPGLADSRFSSTYQYVSFEAWNFPGWYLRDEGGRLVLRQRPTCNREFDIHATFKEVPGLADGSAASYELYCQPGSYIRHRNFHLYVEAGNDNLFKKDATFRKYRPLHDPLPDYVSLKLANAELYVLFRQQGTEWVATVKPLSSELNRVTATFRRCSGLAAPVDDSCATFEALVPDYVGNSWRLLSYGSFYLRHQDYQIKVHERRPINLVDRPEPAALQPKAHDFDGLAEEFLIKHPVGAIAYLGCYTGAQRPSYNLVLRFAEEFQSASAEARLGDIWKGALTRFIDIDFREIDGHLRPGDWYGSAIFQHVHKMMLFGDPSLSLLPARKISVTDELDFGTVPETVTVHDSLEIFNIGSCPLQCQVSRQSKPHAAFDWSPNDPNGTYTPTIEPGGGCSFLVTFTPRSHGSIEDRIVVESDDPDSPEVAVTLKGTGKHVPNPP